MMVGPRRAPPASALISSSIRGQRDPRRSVEELVLGEPLRPVRERDLEKVESDAPVGIVFLRRERFELPPIDTLDDHVVDQRRKVAGERIRWRKRASQPPALARDGSTISVPSGPTSRMAPLSACAQARQVMIARVWRRVKAPTEAGAAVARGASPLRSSAENAVAASSGSRAAQAPARCAGGSGSARCSPQAAPRALSTEQLAASARRLSRRPAPPLRRRRESPQPGSRRGARDSRWAETARQREL